MDSQISKFICLSNIPFDERLFLFREKDNLTASSSGSGWLAPPSEIEDYDRTNPNLLELCKERGYQVKELRYELPDWFLNFKGKRYIKIIGVHSNKFFKDNIRIEKDTKGNYLYPYFGDISENPPTLLTLHSNLASLTNLTGLKISDDLGMAWNNFWGSTLDDNSVNVDINNNETLDYVMTVNQFFTPKVYQIDDDKINEYKTIKFWFEDDKHIISPVLSLFAISSLYFPGLPRPDFKTCELLEFKIEMELVCVSQIV
jgi:hypothetical protein